MGFAIHLSCFFCSNLRGSKSLSLTIGILDKSRGEDIPTKTSDRELLSRFSQKDQASFLALNLCACPGTAILSGPPGPGSGHPFHSSQFAHH